MKICLLSKTSDIECNFSVELTFEYSLLPVGGNFSQIKRRSAQILLRNKYYGQIIFEFVFDFFISISSATSCKVYKVNKCQSKNTDNFHDDLFQ